MLEFMSAIRTRKAQASRLTKAGMVDLSEEMADFAFEGSDGLKLLVVELVQSEDYMPPLLPSVVTRLMKMANDPGVSFDEIEEVVASDAAIAGKIVATANSAFLSRGITIDSIRTAISRLGLLQIRDLAFHAALEAKVFKVPEYERMMQAERKHALGAAMLCRHICKMISIDPEMAFMCGLLHDIGKPVAIGVIAEALKKNKKALPQTEEVNKLLVEVHTEIGERVTRLWKLPSAIVEAVSLHHHPWEKGSLHQLAAVVEVADLCCRHAGIGRPVDRVSIMDHKIFFDLNLQIQDVETLLNYAEELVPV
jgi:putative nucleotidyltransferase with HDIG domain